MVTTLTLAILVGCGSNELKVTVSTSSSDFNVTVYRDGGTFEYYSNNYSRTFDDVESGDYKAKLEWYDSYWETWWSFTSPILHVKRAPLFAKGKYRIELYSYK